MEGEVAILIFSKTAYRPCQPRGALAGGRNHGCNAIQAARGINQGRLRSTHLDAYDGQKKSAPQCAFWFQIYCECRFTIGNTYSTSPPQSQRTARFKRRYLTV